MMTLSKIAELANVSVSTASKAFSGSKEVSQETRDHIFKVAKEYGCLKKFYKKDYYIPVIAVVCPELSGIYARLVSYISTILDKEKCKISISTTHHSVQKKRQLMEFHSRHSVAVGVIIIDHEGSPELPHASFFPADYQKAAEIAVKHLADSGITDIAFVGWQQTEVEGNYNIIENKDAEIAAGKLMEKLPRAIICRDDLLAMGIIKKLTGKGVKIPEQLAVIGMGNEPAGEFMSPSLSTVDFKLKENARLAVKEILRQTDGEAPQEPEYLKPELIIRESI